jgi:diguanylate cyclase (GGDEF)-like protein
MLDIDYFKRLNDTAGHQAGDDCLRAVATMLSESLQRAGDVVARYGGEEFAVLLPETDKADAQHLAERLRARVDAAGSITVSIGVATVVPPADASGCETLVRNADSALYEAKRAGRNRVVASGAA